MWSEQQFNRKFPYGVDSINAKRYNNPGTFDHLSDKELFAKVLDLEEQLSSAKKELESRRKYDDYDGDPTNDTKTQTGIKPTKAIIDGVQDFLRFDTEEDDDDDEDILI